MKKLIILMLAVISFTAQAQVKVLGKIIPNGLIDQYPTHIDSLGQGGLMVFKTWQERNSIPQPRRKAGMVVRVRSASVDSTYSLGIGLTNNDWYPFAPPIDLSGKVNKSGDTMTGTLNVEVDNTGKSVQTALSGLTLKNTGTTGLSLSPSLEFLNARLGSNSVDWKMLAHPSALYIYNKPNTASTWSLKFGLGNQALSLSNANNFSAILDYSGLTNSRVFAFPDKGGTLALLDDITAPSNVVNLTGYQILTGDKSWDTNNGTRTDISDNSIAVSDSDRQNRLGTSGLSSLSISTGSETFIGQNEVFLKPTTISGFVKLQAPFISGSDIYVTLPDEAGVLALKSDIPSPVDITGKVDKIGSTSYPDQTSGGEWKPYIKEGNKGSYEIGMIDNTVLNGTNTIVVADDLTFGVDFGMPQGNGIYFKSSEIGGNSSYEKLAYSRDLPKMMVVTASGDGTTYQFTFPHGLSYTPTMVSATPMTTDATMSFSGSTAATIAIPSYTADATNVTITFFRVDGIAGVPPKNGTNNLKWTIFIK